RAWFDPTPPNVTILLFLWARASPKGSSSLRTLPPPYVRASSNVVFHDDERVKSSSRLIHTRPSSRSFFTGSTADGNCPSSIRGRLSPSAGNAAKSAYAEATAAAAAAAGGASATGG